MTTNKSKQKTSEDLLKRLRLENINKYNELIKLHVSFCVELRAEELDRLVLTKKFENIDETSTTKKRRFTRSSAVFVQKLNVFNVVKRRSCSSQNGTFGVPLTHEGVAEMSQLISFLTQDETNLDEEGIFRISGSSSRQKNLRKVLNVGETVDLTKDKYTVHDVASMLKLYLHELPEPLLSEAHFPIYIKISGFVQENMSRSEKCLAKNRQIRLIRLLLLLLPDESMEFLRQIISLLNSVATRSSKNRMTEENLGKIFGPLLLCPKTLRPDEFHDVADAVAFIVTFMIIHIEEIFKVPKEVLKDVLMWYQKVASTNDDKSFSPEAMTTVRFVDQTKSTDDTAKYNTDTALAGLYAHVQMMPDGPQKTKLLKQFQSYNRENLGVDCNVLSKTSKNATTALKRKLNRTRESFSKLNRTNSRSSLGTMSSNFSDFDERVSFGSSRISDQFLSSLSTITNETEIAASTSQDCLSINTCNLETSTPVPHNETFTGVEKLVKRFGRFSCQYNLRRSTRLSNSSNLVTEKL